MASGMPFVKDRSWNSENVSVVGICDVCGDDASAFDELLLRSSLLRHMTVLLIENNVEAQDLTL